MTVELSAYGMGWLAADQGQGVWDNPFTDELDVTESDSRSEVVLCAERWRAGFVQFHLRDDR